MTPEALRQARVAGDRRATRTQRELADAFGVAGNTVARWERGDLPIPRWVERMVALMDRLDDTERALLRERASNVRLKKRLREARADRKRASTRQRP
jgi:transcriptional regulator with XRE-family HTH domain